MKEPKTHDYSHRYWGHDYTFDPIENGMRASMSGWGHGIEAGDYLIIQDGADRTTRYKVDNIRYCNDPADMWHVKASFAPRSKP